MKKTKVTLDEVKATKQWLENNKTSLPESIHSFLISAMVFLVKILTPTADLKMRKFLELFGITPKSEKGSTLSNQ
jgi:hypothetical protein